MSVYSGWFLVRNWLPLQWFGSQVENCMNLNNMGNRETVKGQTVCLPNKNVWMSAHEILVGITKAPTGIYRGGTRIWDLT